MTQSNGTVCKFGWNCADETCTKPHSHASKLEQITRRYQINATAAAQVTPAQLAETDFYAYSQGIPVSSQAAQTFLGRLIAYGWSPWGSDPEADYNRPIGQSAKAG